jgi:DNA repair ATPase RecN
MPAPITPQEARSRPRSRPTQRYAAAAAKKLSAARQQSAAEKLNKAVNAELAPLKLERAKFITQVTTEQCGRAGAAGHRPRRVLGADQSGHQAGSDDEGRLRRRAVALPAGV